MTASVHATRLCAIDAAVTPLPVGGEDGTPAPPAWRASTRQGMASRRECHASQPARSVAGPPSSLATSPIILAGMAPSRTPGRHSWRSVRAASRAGVGRGPPPRGGPWRRAGGKVAGGQRRGRGWPAAPGNGRRHPRGGCQNRGAVRPSVVPSAVAAGVEWAGVHPDKRRRRRVRRRSLRVYPVSHQIRKTENRFNGRGCGRCPRPHTYGTVQY